jgi:lysophospholipid acyltransferase (LPLAT)-like uncharacterized protein
MRSNYHIADSKGEIDMVTVSDRLSQIAQLLPSHASAQHSDKEAGRNLLTRVLDAVFGFIRRRVPPIHFLGLTLTALLFYMYARIVALTARLVASGEARWPNLPAPSVVALWHGNAPSLLVAYAIRRTSAPAVILIASDPRGDYLALLCRLLGFDVVRAGGMAGDWHPLIALAEKLKQGSCVIITADDGGPAQIAKVGAIALASASGVPLVPLAADCHPALQQSHKWDAARNPLPFSTVTVWTGTPRTFELFANRESLECARTWLQDALNKSS